MQHELFLTFKYYRACGIFLPSTADCNLRRYARIIGCSSSQAACDKQTTYLLLAENYSILQQITTLTEHILHAALRLKYGSL